MSDLVVFKDIIASIYDTFALAGLSTAEVGGLVFVVIIVIKEVFVLLKGDSRKTVEEVLKLQAAVEDLREMKAPLSEVYNFVKQHEHMLEDMEQVNKHIEDMYVWHNKEDSDGVKVWYIRSSLEKTFEKLSTTLDKQNEVLDTVMNKVSSLCNDVSSLKKPVKEK